MIVDQSTGDSYYGILVTGATAAEVTAGRGSTVTVKYAEHYVKGIFIQSAGSHFTADKLVLNASGIAAVAFELSRKNVSANLGSGRSATSIAPVSAFAEGGIVSNQSSLQAKALQITTQVTSGVALRVSGFGSNVKILRNLLDVGHTQNNRTYGNNVSSDLRGSLEAEKNLASLTNLRVFFWNHSCYLPQIIRMGPWYGRQMTLTFIYRVLNR